MGGGANHSRGMTIQWNDDFDKMVNDAIHNMWPVKLPGVGRDRIKIYLWTAIPFLYQYLLWCKENGKSVPADFFRWYYDLTRRNIYAGWYYGKERYDSVEELQSARNGGERGGLSEVDKTEAGVEGILGEVAIGQPENAEAVSEPGGLVDTPSELVNQGGVG